MTTFYASQSGTNSGVGTLGDPFNCVSLSAALLTSALAGSTLNMLDIYGLSEFLITTPLLFTGNTGLIVQSAQSGSLWAARCSKILSSWVKTGGFTNIYEADGEVEVGGLGAATLPTENDIPYTLLFGANFAAISATLDSTPGTSWTGQVSVGDTRIMTFIHPYSSTDPRSDGKIYQRSQLWGGSSESSAVQVQSASLRDMQLLGPMWRSIQTSGSGSTGTNGYGICTLLGTETEVINCKVPFGDKHVIGNLSGATGGSTLLDGCFVGLTNPYVSGGNATSIVAFSDVGNSNIKMTIRNCYSNINNRGLIGSADGQYDESNPLFYSHGGDSWGPVLIENCYFPKGNMALGVNGTEGIRCINTRFGFANCVGNVYIEGCYIDFRSVGGGGQSQTGHTSIIKSTFRPTGSCNNANGDCRPLEGTYFVDQCLIDFTNASGRCTLWSIWIAAETLTIQNSRFLYRGLTDYDDLPVANVRSGTDTFAWNNNEIENPAASGGNKNWIINSTTGFTHQTGGAGVGLMDLAAMKLDSLANSASAQVNNATIANLIDSNDFPLVPTTVRRVLNGVTGGDVGPKQFGSTNHPSEDKVSSGVLYGLGVQAVGTALAGQGIGGAEILQTI